MSKVECASVFTLICQKTDYSDNTRSTCFHFEAYYLHQGKMKAYSLIFLFSCACIYTTVDIMPDLQRNILNFGYGINYKYEGILSDSFGSYYVVTKYNLLIIEDIKISPITFDMGCSYIYFKNTNAINHLPNIRNLCSKIIPFFYYYKIQIDSYIMTN